jgi:hypothetical protein
VLHVLRLRILPLCWEGSGAATASPLAPCGPRASSMKKNLTGLPMQLVSYVPEAHTHVSKTLDISAIMGLQDVCAGITHLILARHVNRWLQYRY